MDTPIPAGKELLQQKIRRWDEALVANSRSLESASIGAGGLTVNNGGNITIRDGGTLNLVDSAKLIIGDGMIEGSALKYQLEIANVSKEINPWQPPPMTLEDVDILTHTIRLPSWANEVTLLLSTSVSAHARKINSWEKSYVPTTRIVYSDGLGESARFMFMVDTTGTGGVSFMDMRNIKGKRAISFAVQYQGGMDADFDPKNSGVRVHGIAIFTK